MFKFAVLALVALAATCDATQQHLYNSGIKGQYAQESFKGELPIIQSAPVQSSYQAPVVSSYQAPLQTTYQAPAVQTSYQAPSVESVKGGQLSEGFKGGFQQLERAPIKGSYELPAAQYSAPIQSTYSYQAPQTWNYRETKGLNLPLQQESGFKGGFQQFDYERAPVYQHQSGFKGASYVREQLPAVQTPHVSYQAPIVHETKGLNLPLQQESGFKGGFQQLERAPIKGSVELPVQQEGFKRT